MTNSDRFTVLLDDLLDAQKKLVQIPNTEENRTRWLIAHSTMEALRAAFIEEYGLSGRDAP